MAKAKTKAKTKAKAKAKPKSAPAPRTAKPSKRAAAGAWGIPQGTFEHLDDQRWLRFVR
jgi:hypothetical protein